MAVLSQARIADLLTPYVSGVDIQPTVLEKVSRYLDLLIHWNKRTNLTAIRDPEDIVRRQMGESLMAAPYIPGCCSVLDFGSGAGFPGIPLALARPDVHVTLAESQSKKAAFLREAVRSLDLSCEVWAGRVEQMPPERCFDVVTMRAVDDSIAMLPVAAARVAVGGRLFRYVSQTEACTVPGMYAAEQTSIPGSQGKLIRLAHGR